MGFYGNITNTSNTTFQFDRIYPNRLTMDANVNNDGIFIGRYVLVEYERKAAYPIVYTKTVGDNLQFYSSPNCEDITRIRFGTGNDQIDENDIVKSYPEGTNETTTDGGEWPIDTDSIKFYYCNGSVTVNEIKYATFVEITKEEEVFGQKSDYILNYAIDENHYYPQDENERRTYKGYDSTVWTKVSETNANGSLITKYVNIADLNSVVPTFDIAADAPTMTPITPHFDADSTNVYYKLHMQQPFGFRVKEAKDRDGKTLLSDIQTVHYIPTYDSNNNISNTTEDTVQANIYFNRAGFDEETSSYKNETNFISLEPSGKSKNYEQNLYSHTPIGDEYEIGDIQEMSIRLSAIGDTISKVWDIIYDNNKGYGADNGTRKRDLDWQYVINDTNGELREPDKGGKTLDISTVAGCINSVHNLMGQIIVNGKTNELTEDKKKYIYYDSNKYWKIVDSYSYSQVNIVGNGIYYVMEDITGAFSRGALWNNNVKEIPTGIKIGTRTTSLAWKELDLGEHLDTLHGQILQFNHIYSDALVNSETRDDNTIVGTLNKLNDIIAKFDELIPGEFVVVDEYGRMHSAAYTTSQPYTSVNYGKSVDGKDTDSYETTEDRWIGIEMNTNYNNPFITITHNFTPVVSTTTISDKNDPEGKDGNNNNTDDDLQLYTPIVDATGHVVGKNIETITLPYGYKTFTTEGLAPLDEENKEIVEDLYTTINNQTDGNNISSSSASTSTSVANNTQDTIAIEPYNKWIQTQLSDDKLVIAHEIHAINTKKDTTDLNDLKDNKIQNKINIPDWDYDEAGHIKKKGDHTYTLPYGYKYITTNGRYNSDNEINTEEFDDSNNASITRPSIVADSTQDTLAINSGNEWIRVDTDATNDILTISHDIHSIEESDIELTNLNESQVDQITVQDTVYDAAGHVTHNQHHTYTLPYGFKTINVQNSDDSISAAPTQTGLKGETADNTQDSLTFEATNKWIKMAAVGENKENKIAFGHKLTGINSKSDTDFGLSSNMSVAQVDANNNQFNIPVFQFDKAGHITEARTHTVTLPDNFASYVVEISDATDKNSTTGKTGAITPDTLTDTLKFVEGNRWINLEADTTNDTITFSHYAKDFSESTGAIDFDSSTNIINNFNIQNITWDRAGHIIASNKVNYILPKSIKTLSIQDTGKDSVNIVTGSTGQLIADNLVDTMTIDNGNRWIRLVANGKTVKLYHDAPNGASGSTNTTNANNNNNKTLSFNSTFEVPQVQYDETGHVFGVNKHTITLPSTSTLQLNDYSKGTSTAAITTNEYINNAFGKLENRLDVLQGNKDVIGSIDNKISIEVAKILDDADPNDIDTLNEIASWIINDSTGAAKMANDISDLKTKVGNVSVEMQITNKINTLNKSDVALDGQYVSAVSETNGIITVIRESLPTLSTGSINGTIKLGNNNEVAVKGLGSAAFTESSTYAKANILDTKTFDYGITKEQKTIADLMNKVAELETELNKLKNQIEPDEGGETI